MQPNPDPSRNGGALVGGRWTIYVCTGCGGATGRHTECDAKREAVDVVPAALPEATRAAHRLLEGLADAEENEAMAGWYSFVSVDDVQEVAREVARQPQPPR